MGIKLISFAILLHVFAYSCNSSKKSRRNDFFIKEDDYTKAYKTAFICGCLNEGTKGNFYKFLRDNNDLGLFTEGDLMSHFKVKEADSLGRIFSSRIKPFTYGDGQGKVPYFSRCILFALSKEVDSIAKESYKQML